MEKIINILEKAMEYMLAIIMFSLVLVVFTQVVLRYVVRTSLPWTEEMARYLFIWLIFIASSVAVKKKQLLGIDFLVIHFSENTQRHLNILSLVLSLVFSVVVILKGCDLINRSRDQISPMLHMSMSFIYIIIPMSYLIIGLLFLWQLYNSFRSKNASPEENNL
jgi:TRAP-type C4-dicarboxylate transport system permease small subunit